EVSSHGAKERVKVGQAGVCQESQPGGGAGESEKETNPQEPRSAAPESGMLPPPIVLPSSDHSARLPAVSSADMFSSPLQEASVSRAGHGAAVPCSAPNLSTRPDATAPLQDLPASAQPGIFDPSRAPDFQFGGALSFSMGPPAPDTSSGRLGKRQTDLWADDEYDWSAAPTGDRPPAPSSPLHGLQPPMPQRAYAKRAKRAATVVHTSQIAGPSHVDVPLILPPVSVHGGPEGRPTTTQLPPASRVSAAAAVAENAAGAARH
ncbi:uncharacterized protein LOC134545701, partial [Bacillus rossius redtenbacheri]|uniref:uncharacterized protein LOC134545701 n=1 Tax=Bacillus rossius redtenbacheri TaxID=93214 RepID=UPI002FDEB00D